MDEYIKHFTEDKNLPVDTKEKNIVSTTDADQDLDYTRKKLKEIVDTVSPVLEHASDIALEGGEPRQIEVVSKLAKDLSDVVKSLLEAGKLKKEIDQKAGIDLNKPGSISQTNNTIFVGSTKELIEQITRQEKVIDITPSEVVEETIQEVEK